MKSFMQNNETVKRDWIVIDAADKPLGRVASKAAVLLRGKHKVTYTPHIDCGDNVIIINAKQVALTGNKAETKMYYTHSRFTGGLRTRKAKEMKADYSVEMLETAIKGMLPKGRLGRDMFRKLYVYEDANHLHTAQQPKEMGL